MSDQEETPKQAKIVACAVARNLEDFELLIDDFEREFGETLGVYAGQRKHQHSANQNDPGKDDTHCSAALGHSRRAFSL